MALIYHYTSGLHLDTILESGELRVSNFERRRSKVKPALWLSLNPVWEHTATKQVNQFGKLIQLTKEQQHQTMGLIRFVLEFNKDNLCNWAKYRYKSKTTEEEYNWMEKVGIKRGAKPREWYASFRNIPLSNCLYCQEWDGNDWVTIIDFTES